MTSIARSIWSCSRVASRPDAGSAAQATRTSTVARAGEQRVDRAALGEVRGQRPRAELAGERLEDVRAAAAEDQVGSAGGKPPRDRGADAAARARQQHARAGDREAHQRENTATLAENECWKLEPRTGPISPAAKKPAVGASANARASVAAS